MDKQAVLLIDEWQNSASNRHNIVTMLSSSEEHNVMLESFDFSLIRETSVNLVEAANKSIEIAKERYDAEVYACVSDNAANMTRIGNMLSLLFTTCNSHSGNLLAGDIFKATKYSRILGKVTTVQKEFRKTGLESRLLIAGGTKPVMSCNTRWTSEHRAAASFLKNLSAMKKVTADCDVAAEMDENAIQPTAAVSQLLFQSVFVESVKKLVEMLDPVAKLTNDCQRRDFSVSDAVEEWLNLLEHDSEELRGFVKSRCNKSNVFNNVTMAANYFHPIYRGRKLNASQTTAVNNYTFELLNAAALESCRLYSTNDGTFGALARKKITSPKTYWHYAIQQGHQELGEFAMKLLKIPASTAQLERLFSNWAFVHSDMRNRLGPDTSKKLVDVYFTLRANDVAIDDDDDD